MHAKLEYARNTLTGLYYVWGRGFVGDLRHAAELDSSEKAALKTCFLNVEFVPVEIVHPELEAAIRGE